MSEPRGPTTEELRARARTDATPAERQSYTPGRFIVSWVPAAGARDPIALTSQVKAMRDGFERLGLKPALLLIVVADGEEDAAVDVRGAEHP